MTNLQEGAPKRHARPRRRAAPIFILLCSFSLSVLSTAQAQTRSADYTLPYQTRALEIYRASIAVHSAEAHGLVPDLANYLADRFREGGFPDEDIHVLPLTLPSGEVTASLVVRYRGDGSSGKSPILLMGHMDVVEALADDWERDPFTLIEENGYFFGRGTLDDKFGTTILTATYLRLKDEGFVPKRDLIIAFTGDEETGQLTTESLVTTYADLTHSEYALNADAGEGVLDQDGVAVSYLLQAAEKTYATFELTTRNPGGHSSMPAVKNAIYDLAAALEKLSALRFPVRTSDITRQYFEHAGQARSGALGEAMRRFAADPNDEQAADVLFNDPSQVGYTRTTCVATMLRGGHAENALPQSATATVNCRIFPGVSIDEVQATLQRVVDNPELDIRVVGEPTASPASPLRMDVVDAVTSAVHTIRPGIAVIPTMSSYGTDGKYTRAAGIPTFGASSLFIRESDIFAHGLNERVPVRSFYDGLEYWYALLHLVAGE